MLFKSCGKMSCLLDLEEQPGMESIGLLILAGEGERENEGKAIQV